MFCTVSGCMFYSIKQEPFNYNHLGPKDTAFLQSDQHPLTERCKLYQLYLPYQRFPWCHSFLSCRPRFPSSDWQSESYLWREMSSRTRARLQCVHFSAREEVCCTEQYTPIAVLDLWTNLVKVIHLLDTWRDRLSASVSWGSSLQT